MQVEEEARSRMTEFGTYLNTLMLSRGLRTYADLSRLLHAKGRNLGRAALSAYATGTKLAPGTLAEKLTYALELDEEEKTRLAYLICYGQE